MATKKPTQGGLKDQLLERLRDPTQLRAVLTLGMILIGYAGIYLPLSSGMGETRLQLAAEQKRLERTKTVEHLRATYQRFQHRLGGKTDANEWVQYVLDGIRSRSVKLTTIDSRAPVEVGPYKAVSLHVELEGRYSEVQEFLGWLESNDRLFRVDTVSLTPHRQQLDILVLQITLLGLMG